MSQVNPQSIGFASCTGGQRPDPPIDDFPLLVWISGVVRLEDGAATVTDVSAMFQLMQDVGRVAGQFGTTVQHVTQALAYAERLG